MGWAWNTGRTSGTSPQSNYKFEKGHTHLIMSTENNAAVARDESVVTTFSANTLTILKNFAQIKLGDFVVARYVEALTLELKKAVEGAGDVSVNAAAARAVPGERPAVGGARQVTVLADVVAVDPVKSTISLKGPKGNVVTLAVHNPAQFKVVKEGDHVEATYTEAFALSVEPAPKPAAAK